MSEKTKPIPDLTDRAIKAEQVKTKSTAPKLVPVIAARAQRLFLREGEPFAIGEERVAGLGDFIRKG
jgi:hypothetical protein